MASSVSAASGEDKQQHYRHKAGSSRLSEFQTDPMLLGHNQYLKAFVAFHAVQHNNFRTVTAVGFSFRSRSFVSLAFFLPLQIIKKVPVSFYFLPILWFYVVVSKLLLIFLLPLSFPLLLVFLNYALCPVNTSGLCKFSTEDNYKQNYDNDCGNR